MRILEPLARTYDRRSGGGLEPHALPTPWLHLDADESSDQTKSCPDDDIRAIAAKQRPAVVGSDKVGQRHPEGNANGGPQNFGHRLLATPNLESRDGLQGIVAVDLNLSHGQARTIKGYEAAMIPNGGWLDS